ncbi:MAG: leucine-rich repeat domain-containing protein, partial [Holosporales bacterium]|nr:leucine-rich repeat domain-containing protein [Holosporales bacterium]
VFAGCLSLRSICLPRGVRALGSFSFERCSALTTITFEADFCLSSMGLGAFKDCLSLQSISIPGGVRTLEMSVFSGCKNLATVTFEGGSAPLHVEIEAFKDCSSLRFVRIPRNRKKTIGQGALPAGCVVETF